MLWTAKMSPPPHTFILVRFTCLFWCLTTGTVIRLSTTPLCWLLSHSFDTFLCHLTPPSFLSFILLFFFCFMYRAHKWGLPAFPHNGAHTSDPLFTPAFTYPATLTPHFFHCRGGCVLQMLGFFASWWLCTRGSRPCVGWWRNGITWPAVTAAWQAAWAAWWLWRSTGPRCPPTGTAQCLVWQPYRNQLSFSYKLISDYMYENCIKKSN